MKEVIMLIQLKQAEIVTAIANYLQAEGIKTAGKRIEVEFTSGRKENGLTADVLIEYESAGDDAKATKV